MIYHDIPMIERLHHTSKGLFILMHGHFGNKQFENFNGLADGLFDLGYDVVSLDAYKHGERKDHPYFDNDPVLTTLEMVTVIDQTLKDIVTLLDRYPKRMQSISIVGISMGGHIAYLINRYVALKFCIPVIGSPNLLWHYETKKQPILNDRYVAIKPKLLDLTLKQSEFNPTYAFALHGDSDDVVSGEASRLFIQSLHSVNYQYQSYPCGHELTNQMVQDIIEFVRKKS